MSDVTNDIDALKQNVQWLNDWVDRTADAVNRGFANFAEAIDKLAENVERIEGYLSDLADSHDDIDSPPPIESSIQASITSIDGH